MSFFFSSRREYYARGYSYKIYGSPRSCRSPGFTHSCLLLSQVALTSCSKE